MVYFTLVMFPQWKRFDKLPGYMVTPYTGLHGVNLGLRSALYM